MTLTETAPAEGSAPPPVRRGLDVLIRVGGVVVALLASVVTAVGELFLTQLRIAGVPTGAAVILAVVANWALCRFVMATTGQRRWIALPWALWTAVMLLAAGTRRTEGDYLLADTNWTGFVMILAGSLTFAVCAYRAILRPNVGTAHRPHAELRDHPPADR